MTEIQTPSPAAARTQLIKDASAKVEAAKAARTSDKDGVTGAVRNVPNAQAAKDAEVLNGVRKPETPEPAKAARKPVKPRASRTSSVPSQPKAPAKPERTRKSTPRSPEEARADAKARTAAKGTQKLVVEDLPSPVKPEPTPEPTAEPNGSAPSAREHNQKLARDLIDCVAARFSGYSEEDQTKIANWLKVLPTGGAAWQRYWPENFARPSTSDWRKPE